MKGFAGSIVCGLAILTGSASLAQSPIVGAWTYAGTGTVNTSWVATPGGLIIVIDV
jgi:hypothetical protein